MFFKLSEQPLEEVAKGVKRRILARGGKLMCTMVEFERGAVGALHNHEHEQISFIMKGSFKAVIGEKTQLMHEGDTYFVPPNVMHGVAALEDAVIVDVFTPQRADFLKVGD